LLQKQNHLANYVIDSDGLAMYM